MVVKKHICRRCKHKWTQRGDKKPKYCPSCHSDKWDYIDSDQLIGLIIHS